MRTLCEEPANKLVQMQLFDGLTITDEDGKTTDLSDVLWIKCQSNLMGWRMSVTDYVDLHQSYIKLICEATLQWATNICNISGKTGIDGWKTTVRFFDV